jgi:glycosyltransferase involved in cell wall biosynthesis
VTALASRAFARRLSEVVRDWRPDVVHFEHVHVAQYLGSVDGAAPGVVRMLEPAAQAALEHARRAPVPARPGALLDAAAAARFERRVLAAADALVVLTEDDRAALARSIPERTPVLVSGLSLVAPAAVGADPPPDCHTFAYVANFAHAPNVHAAELLARRILPAVRARIPAARLLLVGEGSAELGVGGDGVEKTGRVESVAGTLEAAAVVAMPLRTGGGMRVKVFEALALGQAVVATPLAVSGLPVASGEQLLVAESDDELAESIAGLLADPARRSALGAAARRWAVAEAEHDFAARDVRAFYAAVAEGSAAPG